VGKSLEETGIGSYAPPLAFSARLSLKGKLGDAAALEASGWEAVEALLSVHIVDRSAELREMALRRRALGISRELATVAAMRSAEDREKIARARGERDLLVAASAKLLRERKTLSPSLERALEPARRALAADLRPLGDMTDERQRLDSALQTYVQDRFVFRLTDPLVSEIRRAVDVPLPSGSSLPQFKSTRVVAAVRAVLMGAVATLEGPVDRLDRPLGRVIEAAVAAFASALLVEADTAMPQAPFAAIEQRATMVRDALSPKV